MIGLPRCDRCRKRIAMLTVIGPHAVTRLCLDCGDEWHAWRELIYGRREEPWTHQTSAMQ